ncbi:hypothetical protein LTR59_014503 [Friedmanniomyces endolithicus]|nr:hypothetical protein LTR94_022155 [Friedmanniomyces endolithicus]KAK0775558.1 hypothetical protein LTR59_014503 [Friedmanniomyces endolithicus]KAK0806057.1 hypothetical protein LTR38_005274 [Friedmanniomyces endolithicus]
MEYWRSIQGASTSGSNRLNTAAGMQSTLIDSTSPTSTARTDKTSAADMTAAVPISLTPTFKASPSPSAALPNPTSRIYKVPSTTPSSIAQSSLASTPKSNFTPTKARHEQVTITDKNSMHGTFVNMHRLKANEPWVLRTGDSIKLGDKVTRGTETHRGTDVIYRRCEEVANPTSSTIATTTATRTFAVPSDSEDESDNSSVDVPIPTSSANTTPEQPKAMLGSQQKPIDVEKNTSFKTVINLDDDNDDELLYPPLSKTVIDEEAVQLRLIVKDTYDTEEIDPRAVENDAPYLLGRVSPVNENENEDRDESGDEDAPSDTSSLAPSHYGDEEGAHSESGDNLSDSDASDIDISGFEASDLVISDFSDEEDDEDGPEEMSSAKLPSPELGEALNAERAEDSTAVSQPAISASEALRTYGWPQAPPYAPNYLKGVVPSHSRYDPVRGMEASRPYPMGPQLRAPPAYSYGTPTYPGPFTAADAFGSSRWDMQPGNTVEQSLGQGMSLPRPQYPASMPQPLQPCFPPTYHPQYTFMSQPNRVPPPPLDWRNQASDMSTKQRNENTIPAPETVRNKISIPAIVEQPAAEKQQRKLGAPLMHADLPATNPFGSSEVPMKAPQPITSKAAAGSKRKADDISMAGNGEDEVTRALDEIGVDFLNDIRLNICATSQHVDIPREVDPMANNEFHNMLRTHKKARLMHTEAVNMVMSAAKYAAAATAGGAGMMAFLASPYAQQLLDWLA